VNVAPRYLGRGSWLARRDPRVLVLVVVVFVPTVLQIWDLRLNLALLAIALGYYASAGIPFAAVRANWVFVFFFISLLILVNTILTRGEVGGLDRDQLHILFRVPLLGTPVSAESLAYGLTQLVRYISLAAVGFPVAFAVAPADMGVTFARLGIPERFAFAIDLTFRFIPSLARDLQTTVDAQRVRGYDFERLGRGPIGRVRRTVPVLVPLTVNAIAGAEDTIDAMDLRAFGTGRRTWLRELRFDRLDRAVLVFFAALLVAATILGFLGFSRPWVPPFLIDLAGG
jgi:energy-coupling factor transport system permease protein